MHPNPLFRKEDRARNIAFARKRAFGALAISAANGPLVSHVPFYLSGDASRLEAHLVRSNPILRLLDAPQSAVMAITGPDGYISPDWYGIDDQVPTWNYVAIHIRGILRRLEDERLDVVLERISAQMEQRLLPKKPWTINKMTPSVFERMKRQIVPVEMKIDSIDGTWKLSQNKDDDVRLRAAEAATDSSVGLGMDELAALMRGE